MKKPKNALISQTIIDDHIVVVTLDRPDKYNALSPALVHALAEELDAIDKDEQIRCVILTGNGKAFASGADITDMLKRGVDSYLDKERLHDWDVIDHFSKPIIAAVNGYALGGGCELLMLCDIAVASENAKIGQPEIKVGVLPGDGGTQRLPRIVGQCIAMKMVLTGDMVTAEEARRIGLISDVVSSDELLPFAISIAHKIAAQPPLSIKQAKKCVRLARELPLNQGLLAEREAVTEIFDTEDRKEGMRAFLEKRTPTFSGK